MKREIIDASQFELEDNVCLLYTSAYSTKLQKVTLGDKLEQINTPFIGCTNLKQFKADKKEIGYYAVNDVLYYKANEKTYMKCYPAAKQEDSYEFQAGVNGGGLCFTNCRYLKKVVYAKDSIMAVSYTHLAITKSPQTNLRNIFFYIKLCKS